MRILDQAWPGADGRAVSALGVVRLPAPQHGYQDGHQAVSHAAERAAVFVPLLSQASVMLLTERIREARCSAPNDTLRREAARCNLGA